MTNVPATYATCHQILEVVRRAPRSRTVQIGSCAMPWLRIEPYKYVFWALGATGLSFVIPSPDAAKPT
jgi:hypothetical protein